MGLTDTFNRQISGLRGAQAPLSVYLCSIVFQFQINSDIKAMRIEATKAYR